MQEIVWAVLAYTPDVTLFSSASFIFYIFKTIFLLHLEKKYNCMLQSLYFTVYCRRRVLEKEIEKTQVADPLGSQD